VSDSGPVCRANSYTDFDGKQRQASVFVRDVKRTNGTFINGRSVRAAVELHQKDPFRAGPLELGVQGGKHEQQDLPRNRPDEGKLSETGMASPRR
jgi:pSer/pThr/pTyr-binding forkhead associated (FHA) protein